MTVEDDGLPQTLSYYVFNKLRDRIISGELKPGQLLREQELEGQFGSSRGPIRESLRLLLQTGLVDHQPRRGFRVRDYNPADIRNIYVLRANLEGMVIDELEGRELAPLIVKLEGRCRIMQACFAQHDLGGYFDENSKFHQTIIDFIANRPIAMVLQIVNEISLPVRYKLLLENFPTRRSLDYHEQITELLRSHDIKGARAMTERHILENLSRAMAVYGDGTVAHG